jgi:hypothetical protein
VTVAVNDGTDASASHDVTVNVAAVNDAPTATNLSAPETYTEDISLNLTDIVVSDVDSTATNIIIKCLPVYRVLLFCQSHCH